MYSSHYVVYVHNNILHQAQNTNRGRAEAALSARAYTTRKVWWHDATFFGYFDVGITFLGCQAGNRTRACLTASQRTTFWATLLPYELRCTRRVYHNFVHDGRYSEREWACNPHSHQSGLFFPLCWRKWQKVTVATLCTLCHQAVRQQKAFLFFLSILFDLPEGLNHVGHHIGLILLSTKRDKSSGMTHSIIVNHCSGHQLSRNDNYNHKKQNKRLSLTAFDHFIIKLSSRTCNIV